MPGFLLIAVIVAGGDSLDAGTAANESYNPDVALQHLEEARTEGPYDWADHVLLFEQLALAHAYLDHKKEALAAFDAVLALDPGHGLSCRLSPKATFLFEQARSQPRSHPVLDLSLPRDALITDAVAVGVQLVANPRDMVNRISVFTRRGDDEYQRHDLDAPAVGGFVDLTLPPPKAAAGPGTLTVYATASDARGNEVLVLGSPEQPREINLGYEPPDPWYQQWWVWAITGVVVAGAVGGVVYSQTRALPDTVTTTGNVR